MSTQNPAKSCVTFLSLLSMSHVEDFYRESHRECCLNDKTFPAARSIQQLVQAWKQLRKWRKQDRWSWRSQTPRD
jgi:hypothetical protein